MQYPISSIAVTLGCADEDVLLYVLASAKTFGIIIPMSVLPQITHEVGEDPHQVLFGEVVDSFSEIADAYLDMADEYGTTLPLPEVEVLGVEYSGEFLKISGTIEEMKNKKVRSEQLALDGEYFFIAPAGVAIEAFLAERNKNAEGHTLH